MKYVYVGCRTTKQRNARGRGLTVYEILSDGSWQEKQCLFVEDNPSFQCFDRSKQFLYSVHGDLSLVSSYKILKDGTLELLNTLDIGGKNPVDITVDASNRFIIVATLQGGTLYSIERLPDGSLGRILSCYTYEGKEEGDVSTIHQCLWDHSMKYLFACAQGRVHGFGQMRTLKFDSSTGQFQETSRFMSRTWDEPRHAAIHPNNRWLYMCEEKGNKIIYFHFDSQTGHTQALQELSTVPETITGYSDASEVMISPDGEYVLVSNRYTDLMTVFRIDPCTGYLKMVSSVSCLGKTPRFFCFGPDNKCYVANEDSDTIVQFHFDPSSGQLIPTTNIIHTGSPVCINFL